MSSRESLTSKRHRANQIFKTLESHYPKVTTFLTHDSDFQLLIAVILSAQCTDARVNMVTPGLFDKYPTANDLSSAQVLDVMELIQSVNYYKTKSKNIIQTAEIIMNEFEGVVPNQLDQLIKLPGVGRKTANVVLGQAFGIPGITVDTHVKRLNQRWKFTSKSDANLVEKDLIKVWDESTWIDFSSLTILHGREVCDSRRPRCSDCIISEWCPSYKIN